ncbi:MAG: GNAT family N-acetyltransferase [Myxococcota bacterium]|nr:GNAT family N-acetyltransferase [Myxococcota bacterium]
MIELLFLDVPQPTVISQISALYQDTGWWEEAPHHPDRVRQLITGSHCFVAAMEGETVVAMGRAISDRVGDAYIQDVTVATPWRGQGIAKKIIRSLIARLRSDGIDWIGLIAESGSRGLYEPLGFVEMPNAAPLVLKHA